MLSVSYKKAVDIWKVQCLAQKEMSTAPSAENLQVPICILKYLLRIKNCLLACLMCSETSIWPTYTKKRKQPPPQKVVLELGF